MDATEPLVGVLLVLVAARLAAEGAERLGAPAVLGEIFAGILIGPSVLGLVGPGDVLRTLAELGAVLLLLQVGLELDVRELRDVGAPALRVALVGVVLPLAGGAAVGIAFGLEPAAAVFLGAALTATSVGLTARVFADLGALELVEARTVLAAAVADDVIGLVVLAVVSGVATGAGLSIAGSGALVAGALGFVVCGTVVGVRVAPPLFRALERHSRTPGAVLVVALAFSLVFAVLADAASLAPIVGAFVGGLALARAHVADSVRRELTPVAQLLVPVFFLQVGIDVHVDEFMRADALGLAAALFAVAVLGKLAAGMGLLASPGDRLLVGIGMIPRGEVGLVFATLGLREGVFGPDVHAALLAVVLASTICAVPALRWRLLGRERLASRVGRP